MGPKTKKQEQKLASLQSARAIQHAERFAKSAKPAVDADSSTKDKLCRLEMEFLRNNHPFSLEESEDVMQELPSDSTVHGSSESSRKRPRELDSSTLESLMEGLLNHGSEQYEYQVYFIILHISKTVEF